ncbi:hypothetical protein NL676_014139 [Syzygium grande]|nr:hypothetical protein NL676_014139 [Syzygium grande]
MAKIQAGDLCRNKATEVATSVDKGFSLRTRCRLQSVLLLEVKKHPRMIIPTKIRRSTRFPPSSRPVAIPRSRAPLGFRLDPGGDGFRRAGAPIRGGRGSQVRAFGPPAVGVVLKLLLGFPPFVSPEGSGGLPVP